MCHAIELIGRYCGRSGEGLGQFVADGGDRMVQISERRNGWIQL